MIKRLLGATSAFILVVVLPMAACAANDPGTGLPLFPSAAYPNPMDAHFCSSAMKMAQYFVPNSTHDARVLAWMSQHLAGFNHVSGKTDRTQDGYFKPDGTVGVGVTGEPKGDGVFSVAYYRFTPGLTPFQQKEIVKQSSTCK